MVDVTIYRLGLAVRAPDHVVSPRCSRCPSPRSSARKQSAREVKPRRAVARGNGAPFRPHVFSRHLEIDSRTGAPAALGPESAASTVHRATVWAVMLATLLLVSCGGRVGFDPAAHPARTRFAIAQFIEGRALSLLGPYQGADALATICLSDQSQAPAVAVVSAPLLTPNSCCAPRRRRSRPAVAYPALLQLAPATPRRGRISR